MLATWQKKKLWRRLYDLNKCQTFKFSNWGEVQPHDFFQKVFVDLKFQNEKRIAKDDVWSANYLFISKCSKVLCYYCLQCDLHDRYSLETFPYMAYQEWPVSWYSMESCSLTPMASSWLPPLHLESPSEWTWNTSVEAATYAATNIRYTTVCWKMMETH